jgi:hypothetical protein
MNGESSGVVKVDVKINKIQMPTGVHAVQMIVTIGLLSVAFTMDSQGAKGVARALALQAEACEKSIILAPGPLPPSSAA